MSNGVTMTPDPNDPSGPMICAHCEKLRMALRLCVDAHKTGQNEPMIAACEHAENVLADMSENGIAGIDALVDVMDEIAKDYNASVNAIEPEAEK